MPDKRPEKQEMVRCNCKRCGKRLFDMEPGSRAETVCHRCKHPNVFDLKK